MAMTLRAALAVSLAIRGPGTVPVDTGGTFRIYKLQHDVGTETYSITQIEDKCAPTPDDTVCRVAGPTVRAARTLTTTRWSFRYLGSRVDLSATIWADSLGRPVKFVERGKTSTLTDVDVAIDIDDARALVRDRGVERVIDRPPSRSRESFPIASYPPVAVEQALFRRWQSVGRPREIPLLPRGTASFHYRGLDTVIVHGRKVQLRRYAVTGLLWGRQSMWSTPDDAQIVGVVNGDAELDRFEAVRDGYTDALLHLVRSSVRDDVSWLREAAIAPIANGTYAIAGATVIDGTGSPPMHDAVIVVRNGRIAAVGPSAKVSLPHGIVVREMADKTILPGLWDMHVHFEQVEWPMAQLAAGVTTARDVGNELELATGLRDAIDRGRAVGPRMLLAGLIDGAPDGLGVHLAGTPEQARDEVRRYHDAGYRQIKIYQSVPPELVSVIANAAHELGMTVTGHVPTGMNATQFVEAGADQINHIGFVLNVMQPSVPRGQPRPPVDLSSEQARSAIAFFAAHHTVLDPTLARSEENGHPKDSTFARYEPGAAKAPPELADVLEATGSSSPNANASMARFAANLPAIVALHDAGVPIVAGTDLVVPGYSIYRELELEVQAGFTPMQAIQAATSVPARVMGLDGESGTIEAGKRADLLILNADPLANISNLRRVHAVVANGRMYNPAPLWQAVGFAKP